jgi:DNA-binding transcriptional ArsR family regulator
MWAMFACDRRQAHWFSSSNQFVRAWRRAVRPLRPPYLFFALSATTLQETQTIANRDGDHVSATLQKAVYTSTLKGILKPIAAFIAFTVLDDRAAARRRQPARIFYLSIAAVSDALGARPKTVRRHIRELVRCGLLTVMRPGGGRRRFGRRLAGLATTYEFHPEALPFARPIESEKNGAANGGTLSKKGTVAVQAVPQKGTVGCRYLPQNGGGLIETKELSKIKEPQRPVGAAPDGAPLTNAAIRRLIKLFQESFESRFGQKPLIAHGKDGALLKQLVCQLGEDDTADLIGRFFASADPFVVRSNYSIGNLVQLANRLRVADAVTADSTTAANIDAALRATRPRVLSARQRPSPSAAVDVGIPTFSDSNIIGGTA